MKRIPVFFLLMWLGWMPLSVMAQVRLDDQALRDVIGELGYPLAANVDNRLVSVYWKSVHPLTSVKSIDYLDRPWYRALFQEGYMDWKEQACRRIVDVSDPSCLFSRHDILGSRYCRHTQLALGELERLYQTIRRIGFDPDRLAMNYANTARNAAKIVTTRIRFGIPYSLLEANPSKINPIMPEWCKDLSLDRNVRPVIQQLVYSKMASAMENALHFHEIQAIVADEQLKLHNTFGSRLSKAEYVRCYGAIDGQALHDLGTCAKELSVKANQLAVNSCNAWLSGDYEAYKLNLSRSLTTEGRVRELLNQSFWIRERCLLHSPASPKMKELFSITEEEIMQESVSNILAVIRRATPRVLAAEIELRLEKGESSAQLGTYYRDVLRHPEAYEWSSGQKPVETAHIEFLAQVQAMQQAEAERIAQINQTRQRRMQLMQEVGGEYLTQGQIRQRLTEIMQEVGGEYLTQRRGRTQARQEERAEFAEFFKQRNTQVTKEIKDARLARRPRRQRPMEYDPSPISPPIVPLREGSSTGAAEGLSQRGISPSPAPLSGQRIQPLVPEHNSSSVSRSEQRSTEIRLTEASFNGTEAFQTRRDCRPLGTEEVYRGHGTVSESGRFNERVLTNHAGIEYGIGVAGGVVMFGLVVAHLLWD